MKNYFFFKKMGLLIFLLALLLVPAPARYLVEYTHSVPEDDFMYAVACSMPGCNTVYKREIKFCAFDGIGEALAFINDAKDGLVQSKPDGTLWTSFRPRDFKFVALHKLAPLPVEYVKVGEETRVEHVPTEVTVDRMEWRVKEE